MKRATKASTALVLTKAQIGRCGELFLQYRLLMRGIDSAPMSTDSGVDLVAYSPHTGQPITIQVKTNLKPKPGGGKGKAALDWWIEEDNPAQFAAFVDLSCQRVWLFAADQLANVAQQQSSGKFHLYMYTDSTAKTHKASGSVYAYQFEPFLLEHCGHKVFGA